MCEIENKVIKEQLSKKERELAEAVHQLEQKVKSVINFNDECMEHCLTQVPFIGRSAAE